MNLTPKELAPCKISHICRCAFKALFLKLYLFKIVTFFSFGAYLGNLILSLVVQIHKIPVFMKYFSLFATVAMVTEMESF